MGLAQALNGRAGIWGLAADTDGIDGVEHNAGALVTPSTLTRAAAAGVSLSDCLTRNDGFGFFNAIGDLGGHRTHAHQRERLPRYFGDA